MRKLKCLHCSSDFETSSGVKLYCSKACKMTVDRAKLKESIHNNRVNSVSEDEVVECMICNGKYGTLMSHMARTHNIPMEEYKKQFPGCKIVSAAYSRRQSEHTKGEKNPGYQHGGRLSPWSKKSEYHSEEQRISARKKAVENYAPEDRDNTLVYYTSRGMSEEEAREAQSERQRTFTLEKCIERHGEEKGREIHAERQVKWMESLDAKTEEEKLEINRKKAWSNGSKSLVENKLRNELLELGFDVSGNIPICKNITVDIAYGEHIIEFYGDFWHMNPLIYKPDYTNAITKLTATEKWDRDAKRETAIRELGYELKVVWEKDYIKNKEQTVRECVEFLTKGNNVTQ